MKRTISVGKTITFLGIMVLVLVVCIVALPVKAHAPGVVLSGLGTASIDGILSTGEWDNADHIDFNVNVPEGGTTPGTVFVMNDATNLYLAIRFTRSVVDPGNTASFRFDNDHDGGLVVTGDDVILINPSIGFRDNVYWGEPPCPPGSMCSFFDTMVGGTNDGTGAFLNDGTSTVYEFSHPLDSADDTHDFSLVPGDTVGFCLFIRIIKTGSVDTHFPAPTPSPPWSYGDIVIASPVMPVDIDIKPGSDPNSINPKSKGVIPVAILTTPDFDATTVDWITVMFGPNTANPVHDLSDPLALADHQNDVDEDGDVDFVFHFRTQDSGIAPGDTKAYLKGTTLGGISIEGWDSIRTVGH